MCEGGRFEGIKFTSLLCCWVDCSRFSLTFERFGFGFGFISSQIYDDQQTTQRCKLKALGKCWTRSRTSVNKTMKQRAEYSKRWQYCLMWRFCRIHYLCVQCDIFLNEKIVSMRDSLLLPFSPIKCKSMGILVWQFFYAAISISININISFIHFFPQLLSGHECVALLAGYFFNVLPFGPIQQFNEHIH